MIRGLPLHAMLACLCITAGVGCRSLDIVEPEGPPHPSNLSAAATETRANAQHTMDEAVDQGMRLKELNKQLQPPKRPYAEFDNRVHSTPQQINQFIRRVPGF